MADSGPRSRENLTLGLGLGALLFWVVGVFLAEQGDEQGWPWVVMAVFGLAATVVGLMSLRRGSPGARAITGLVLGVLAVLIFLVFSFGIVE